MGQLSSKPTNLFSDASQPLQVLQQINVPYFGDIKIIQDNKTRHRMLLKEVTIPNNESSNRILDKYSQLASISHPNIVNISSLSKERNTGLLESSYNIMMSIEMLGWSLEEELQERMKTGNYFNENQLLQIAKNVNLALDHLHTQGIAHGNVRPSTIFPSSHYYKLSNPALSPLSKLENEDTESEDRFKNDILSLGVTLLSLATLTDGEDIYDQSEGSVNKNAIEKRLEIMKNLYSDSCYNQVKRVLMSEGVERPNFGGLSEKILQFKDYSKIDNKSSNNSSSQRESNKENINIPSTSQKDTQEPTKIGGIIIDQEAILPSQRQNFEPGLNKVQLHLKDQSHNNPPSNNPDPGKWPTRNFNYEHDRPAPTEDVIKTGGIVISAEDMLPSERYKLQVDPNNSSTTYVMLTPGNQLKEKQQEAAQMAQAASSNYMNQGEPVKRSGYMNPEEQRLPIDKENYQSQEPTKIGGIVIDPQDMLPSQRQQSKASSDKVQLHLKDDWTPSSTDDNKPGQWTTRSFDYRYRRSPETEDIIKTGGVIIKPEDVLPSERHRLHVNPSTSTTYAMLIPGSQLMKMRQNDSSKTQDQPSSQTSFGDNQQGQWSTRNFDYKLDRQPGTDDVIKTGGIVISPEDALPSERSKVLVNPNNSSTYAMLIPGNQLKEKQQEAAQMTQATSSNYMNQGERVKRSGYMNPEEQRLPIDKENYQSQEPIKIGGIIIDPQDMLPSQRQQSKASSDKVQLHLKDDWGKEPKIPTSAEEKKPVKWASRGFSYEYKRPTPPEDVIKTGGIVISPEDMLPSERSKLQVDPNNSSTTYVMLTPGNQLKEKQQEASRHSEILKTRSLNQGEEPVKRAGHIVNPQGRLPSNDKENEKSQGASDKEPTKIGGIIINPDDILPSQRQNFSSNKVQLHNREQKESQNVPKPNPSEPKEREFSMEYIRSKDQEPIKKEFTGGVNPSVDISDKENFQINTESQLGFGGSSKGSEYSKGNLYDQKQGKDPSDQSTFERLNKLDRLLDSALSKNTSFKAEQNLNPNRSPLGFLSGNQEVSTDDNSKFGGMTNML